ncbi:MAG: hypothetical protein II007_00775 [Gammaproteobacteria bacterium]|nr:hypothetical protein [Gammaproteobacteria bacterium]
MWWCGWIPNERPGSVVLEWLSLEVLGSSTLLAASYNRDRLGRITSRSLNVLGQSVSDSYHYDAAGRLWQVERGSTSVSYSYDDNGNRLSKTTVSDGVTTTVSASYDAQDRLLTAGTCSYSYSANGELQQKTCGTATTRYDYDLLGNLRQVRLPGDVTIDYLTDGQDRRIGKRVNGVLVQGLRYGDQLNPVAELDGSGTLVSRFVYARFVWRSNGVGNMQQSARFSRTVCWTSAPIRYQNHPHGTRPPPITAA